MFIKRIFTTTTFLCLPLVSFAQNFDSTNAGSLVKSVTRFISQRLIPLMVLLALVYIIYAVVNYIGADAESQEKNERKQQIFWGIIGLFVIISIWALVAIVANTFGIFAGGTLNAGN